MCSARAQFLIVALLAAGGCRCPGKFTAPTDSVLLDIPDRPEAAEAPPEGWCGEASIQMVALYRGAYAPQALINKLGKPQTPDLWEQDVPTALTALKLGFSRFDGGQGTDPFLSWIVAEVRQGRPVIIGVKLYPSDHPDWEVDHLAVVVGYTPLGLVINTTVGGRQITVHYPQLEEPHDYSLVSPTGRHHGYSIQGFAGAPLTGRVTEEGPTISLEVRVRGLVPGNEYSLTRDDLLGQRSTSRLIATSSEQVLREVVAADQAAVFSCEDAQ